MNRLTIMDLQAKYGIRRHTVAELVRAGLIVPAVGSRREYRFAFHDVVVLRMAQDLARAGIPAAKSSRFLKRLRADLPDMAKAGMRVSTAGREMVVRRDGRLVNPDGQFVIDFDTSALANVSDMLNRPRSQDKPASYWFEQALAAEAGDAPEAMTCYRRAIEAEPCLAEAHVNLACLLVEAGRFREALMSVEDAIKQCPGSALAPLMHFNRGVIQEEMNLFEAALQSYMKALELDPELADAHYNVGRLHEVMGHARAAIRHFSAYRRLYGKQN